MSTSVVLRKIKKRCADRAQRFEEGRTKDLLKAVRYAATSRHRKD
jgi:hypothetical protein